MERVSTSRDILGEQEHSGELGTPRWYRHTDMFNEAMAGFVDEHPSFGESQSSPLTVGPDDGARRCQRDARCTCADRSVATSPGWRCRWTHPEAAAAHRFSAAYRRSDSVRSSAWSTMVVGYSFGRLRPNVCTSTASSTSASSATQRRT